MDLIKYKVSITPTFGDELEQIYRYMIYNLKVPRTAYKFNKKVKNCIHNLNYFPERFPKILDSNKNDFRKLIIENFVIIFEIDFPKQQINVLYIFYGQRNYLKLL